MSRRVLHSAPTIAQNFAKDKAYFELYMFRQLLQASEKVVKKSSVLQIQRVPHKKRSEISPSHPSPPSRLTNTHLVGPKLPGLNQIVSPGQSLKALSKTATGFLHAVLDVYHFTSEKPCATTDKSPMPLVGAASGLHSGFFKSHL